MEKIMAKAGTKARPKTVVDRAIEKVADGNASDFARRLSKQCGFAISRQRVHNRVRRGCFSRDVVVAVHELSGINMTDLVSAPWLQK